jgi:hypothetical protein
MIDQLLEASKDTSLPLAVRRLLLTAHIEVAHLRAQILRLYGLDEDTPYEDFDRVFGT